MKTGVSVSQFTGNGSYTRSGLRPERSPLEQLAEPQGETVHALMDGIERVIRYLAGRFRDAIG